MSRTRRSSKPPGYEFWSARPGNPRTPGPVSKTYTHRAERRAAAKQVREAKEDA